MKKFNLQKALKGETVVTRCGERVRQIHLFQYLAASEQPLYGVIEGRIEYWNVDGTYSTLLGESSFDLFMEAQ